MKIREREGINQMLGEAGILRKGSAGYGYAIRLLRGARVV